MNKKQKNEKPVLPSSNKALVKKFTPEEVKERLIRMVSFGGDLDQSLRQIGENMLPKIINGSEKESEEARNKLKESVNDVMLALSAHTHFDIVETFNQEYRGLAKELTVQLEKEYDCKTPSEKLLATLSANAYLRVVDNSKRLNNDLGGPGTTINENKTKYYSMLSKQIDRAHRQFITSLTTLKQLKSPRIEMNIKTQNAFIAQNQQINSDYPPKTTNSDNNESK